MEFEYKRRTVEIQIQSEQLMAPSPVGYACVDGENQPFLATFYQETDPPSAGITYGDEQTIAFLAPSGSGSKYTAPNMEFWKHRGEASVDWYGTKLVCKPR